MRTLFAFLICALLDWATSADSAPPAQAMAVVQSMLKEPEAKLDYGRAADNFSKLLDPANNTAATDTTIDRLVDAARQMAGPNPTDSYKLAAIRKAIYDPGPWNYNRAFGYDQIDPFGKITANRLLSTYVATRQGNCVSMPTLFLIVADRLGLKVHLAEAPLHMFIRYTDPSGTDHNLEATSGGHEARTEWMRQNMQMTDLSITSGFYMRTLSKRESIAFMATTVVDFLLDEKRYEEASDVADAILSANPRDAYTMVKKGTAIAGMMRIEFDGKYPSPDMIPSSQRRRYAALAAANAKLFRDAEALGWQPVE